MKRLLFLIFLFCSPLLIYSQTEQAWVFFTEKENINTELLNPNRFLTQKAILRKERLAIEIDSRDIPISDLYINTIKGQEGITYLATSKWFNAVYVEGNKTNIDFLQSLEIVDSVFYMNRDLNASNKQIAGSNSAGKKLQVNKTDTVTDFIYGTTEDQTTQLNLDLLHNEDYTGNGYTIAVMDNGFNNVNTITAFNRARENDLIMGGYDFEDKTDDIYAYTGGSHGTNVLSVMLGYIENQFVGAAIDAEYYLFRTEVDASESPKEEAYWIAAAERADSLGVDIINSSLGYSTFDDSKYDYSTINMDGKTTFISQGASIAAEKGILVVSSAGNAGNTAWRIVTAPADAENILSIGAVNIDNNLANFSSIGPTADGRTKPNIVALGVNTPIIASNGSIASSNGTSFSAPIIAGAMACLWQSSPEATITELISAIQATGSQSENPDNLLGYGVPNFYDALSINKELSLNEVTAVNETDFFLIRNPVLSELTFNFPNDWVNDTFYIFSLSGDIVKSDLIEKNTTVGIEELSIGIYFFRLKNSKNIIKFVKY